MQACPAAAGASRCLPIHELSPLLHRASLQTMSAGRLTAIAWRGGVLLAQHPLSQALQGRGGLHLCLKVAAGRKMLNPSSV